MTSSWEELKTAIQKHIEEQSQIDRDYAFHPVTKQEWEDHWPKVKECDFGVTMKHCAHGWENDGYYFFFKWENQRVVEVEEVEEVK